jgi:hypothetical protein
MKNLIVGLLALGSATAFAQYQPKIPDIKNLGKVSLLSINEVASIPVVDYKPINGQQAQQGTYCPSRYIEMDQNTAVSVGNATFVCH